MILREKTKKEILLMFETTILGQYAFDIKFPDETGASPSINHFIATYIGDENYFLKIFDKYDSDKKVYGFGVTYSPGAYLKDQETVFEIQFSPTLSHLQTWLGRLVTDIKDRSPLINKVYEEIHRIEEEFEQKINEKFESAESSYFNQEEITDLKEKIDSLYTKFESLKEEQNSKDIELKTIKQELEKLKTTLPILPKETWYKSSGKKIINLIGKYLNPDTIKSIATEVVKGFLNQPK